MNLYNKIMSIYPELTSRDFMDNIVLRNDSDGKDPYIAAWNHPTLAKPTPEQLGEIQ